MERTENISKHKVEVLDKEGKKEIGEILQNGAVIFTNGMKNKKYDGEWEAKEAILGMGYPVQSTSIHVSKTFPKTKDISDSINNLLKGKN